MDNKDYNEPMRDYCSPEEENRYERPSYETAEEYNQARREREQAQSQPVNEQYSYNQYNTADQSDSNSASGSNPYGNASYYGNTSSYGNASSCGNSSYYGNGGYTNMGGVILDSNGKPLKNNFGIKLTFSILEMLCCCANFITMIMGILSCVFTCQANTSYNEGRYDEFKSKSKASTIMLIVGAVFAAISIFINALFIGFGMADFWQEFANFDMDIVQDDFDYDYDEDFKEFYNENAQHENFEDFNQVTVDGVTISLPCTYADLEAAGFFLNHTDLNAEIDAGSYEFFELHSNEKTYIADVQVVNPKEESVKAEDGMIIYLSFYYESAEETEVFKGYEFVNGLDVFGTVDETLEILGEPDYNSVGDTDYGKQEYYEWYYEGEDGYLSYITINFYDGELFSITINNGPEEY